jgi:hypothetical protein
MGKSKPFDLAVMVWTPIWENSDRYKGNVYGRDNRDLRAAKEWLVLHPWDAIDWDDFHRRALEYIADNFEGFVNANHPMHHFLNHYSRYGVKRAEQKQPKKLYKCGLHPDVGQFEHPLGCPRCYAKKEA